MKKKTWANPELHIIATTDVSSKYINGFHEHAFTTHATPKGRGLFNNTPNHSLFQTNLTKTLLQYLS
ncbi:hypothetical protein BEL04_12085 [Mucilaginibacter sp. PPCGB 2223]|uniref:hypothetical protein n=1 Tax=Mucilaginibacter sp. PPCGB 2223 TaxID=1886027 RepID=UPI000825DA1A|nr:hypothetical protein [Mucilaginibacter sp. PPCGB 2223]OCX52217.1 hypothetical protein BEL04_12085 [Mucilaginibacter sp. PPCGB 2223]